MAGGGPWSRYAGAGVAWECLAGQMNITAGPLPASYDAFSVRTGSVTCGTLIGPTAGTLALWFLLVALHAALVVSPAVVCWQIGSQLRGQALSEAVNSVGLVLAAMPVFSVAAYGEVAQHMFDNWLYLGLLPSYNIAIFYGGLTFAQAVLALGAQSKGPWGALPLVDFAFCAAATVALIIATGPYMLNGVSTPDWVWVIVFFCLFWTSAAVFFRTESDSKLGYAIGTAAAFAVGVISAVFVSRTGLQWLHVPTASGFLVGFWVEMRYILSGLKRPRAHQE